MLLLCPTLPKPVYPKFCFPMAKGAWSQSCRRPCRRVPPPPGLRETGLGLFSLPSPHLVLCPPSLSPQVPATREVLGSLPNVFSALCLNARGLQSFVQCQPFERLFKVLLSPDYLPAMRRRRSSDPLGESSRIWDSCSIVGGGVSHLEGAPKSLWYLMHYLFWPPRSSFLPSTA